MKCPICAGADLVQDTRDITYTYKGEHTSLPHVKGQFCTACGEGFFDEEESQRVHVLMTQFNKQVNASIIDPAFIARVRKKLQLGQREAAEIFGGGINSFSRYETGKTKPPVSLVKLLTILDHHPKLLTEIRLPMQ